MTQHVIVVQKPVDQEWAAQVGLAVTARDYITAPEKFTGKNLRVINLSDDFEYLDHGYYCSLLAEARGQKVIPTVETIIDLSRKALYQVALPELNAELRKDIERLTHVPHTGFSLIACFGQAHDSRFSHFTRSLFDRFRCPLLHVQVALEERWAIKAIEPITPADLSPHEFDFFLGALEGYTRAHWRTPKLKTPPRYSLAVLHNPREALPPSNKEALKKLESLGPALGIGVELIQAKDFLRLAEYDALFIRETTALDNHTYRFARRAWHEGMAVIDDPTSILRCTNKVYLAELLQANGLPAPKTLIVDRQNLLQAEEQLGYPMVLKIPDGSFSRGVVKCEKREELVDLSRKLFQRSDVILAQQFMYTEFDWRVGVLNRQPLFVSQYFMSRNHWQIVKHGEGGRFVEGGYKTLLVEEAPPHVVELGLRAAGLIGDGFYGIDIKETAEGVYVIEINDNPNLDRGVEDAALKDELYRIVLKDFIRRIEAR